MNAIADIKKTEAEKAYSHQFESLRNDLPGNEWARARREAAIKTFAENGLPHRRIEAWKYTDLRMNLKEALQPSSDNLNSVSDKDLYQSLGADLHGISAHHLVFVDGVYDENNSFIISDEAAAIDMFSLREILEQPPEWFKRCFGEVNPDKGDPILALNTAFMSDGAVIEITKNAQLKRPIHLIYISSAADAEAINERNFIHVERGAKVTILESYVHLRAPQAQRNSATEMSIEEGAQVNHIKFQNEGAKAVHLGNWMTRLEANTTYRAFQFSVGAGLSRNTISVKFNGEGAFADISGTALLWDKQHCDTTLIVDHAVPNCTSRELFKTVLDDQARGVFQGKLIVRPDAQHTDAKQMARSLMMSDSAEFDAKPELEIYADDVACGHGATSGMIDEDLLFYMRSRGIPEEEAQRLLIAAFVGEALELVEGEDIRHALTNLSNAWLGANGNE